MDELKIYFNGAWRRTKKSFPVFNPYSGEEIAQVHETDEESFLSAISGAKAGVGEINSLPVYERAEILSKASSLLQERGEEFAQAITKEAGKAIKYSRGEVGRAIENFRFASEVIKHLKGSVLKGDAGKGGVGRTLFYERFPLGVIAAITPFNFPLNLAVHKLAPAFATGNSVIFKPSSYTPVTAVKLVQLLLDSGYPKNAINLVTGPGDLIGRWINNAPEIRMITFTGSPEVGKTIKSQSGLKKVSLELGSNSPVIIEDVSNMERLIPRLITGICANSGQVCISLQRIYCNEKIYDELRDSLISAVKKVPVGDPSDENVEYGPMITEKEAIRIENWVKTAVKKGAKVLAGGTRYKSIIQPTIIENVNSEMEVYSREVFGPVACLIKYDSFEEVLDEVNLSEFGLNAGVFTCDINKAMKAYKKLETGAVIINDIPTWRVDHMPYGGVKGSGIGREGTEFAMEEMTEIKLMVIKQE